MASKLRRFGLLSKAALFTVAIHGVLMAFLLYSFSWAERIERGEVRPIQAVAVSEQELLAQAQKKREAEEKRQEAEQKKKREAEEKRMENERKQQIETDKKRREAEERKKREAEEKRMENERKQQIEIDKKRREAEEREKREAEEQRMENERKKQLEADKKRREAEQKKKREAEEKRKEADRRRAEQLRRQIEEEQRAQTRKEAGDALSALVDRIAAAVEDNWRRPPNTRAAGLTAIIRVKVAPDGRVISVRVTRGSGNPNFDQSAEIAVEKASPLPFPENPKYYEFISEFDFKFSPND